MKKPTRTTLKKKCPQDVQDYIKFLEKRHKLLIKVVRNSFIDLKRFMCDLYREPYRK